MEARKTANSMDTKLMQSTLIYEIDCVSGYRQKLLLDNSKSADVDLITLTVS